MNLKNYFATANDTISLILQIEHIDAVNNIEEITDVPGFDALFVGPFDLSGSLGCPGDVTNELVLQAIEKVKDTCQRKDIPLGLFTATADGASQAKQAGYNLIAVGTDTMHLWKSAKESLAALK